MRTLLALGAAVLLAAATPVGTTLPLPDGKGGIGFDDLTFSASLGKVLVPSGRTGRLNLIDPKTHAIESIGGFSSQIGFAGGHGAGTTSADSGRGLIVASDRSRKLVDVIDPKTKRILGSAHLGGGPDYVRWVEPLSEVWVTEPGRKVIEHFKLSGEKPPELVLGGTIEFPDGPESLVI